MASSQCWWGREATRRLVLALLDETRRGKCSDCGLTVEAWTRIASRLASDGRSKQQIRAKVRRLKKQHNIYDALISKSGFGYNPSNGSCDVPDDVWSRYVSANPGAAAYKNRPLELYSELHEIFASSVATGEFVISTLVAAPIPDASGATNDWSIENVTAASVPSTETMVSDGGGGSVDGDVAAEGDRAAALDAPAPRNHLLLAPVDRQTGKRKSRGSGAALAEAVNYYARVLEKTLEHNAPPTQVQQATIDFIQRFSSVFDPLDRARYISHFADHPQFAEVYNVADVATKRALISRLQLQRQ